MASLTDDDLDGVSEVRKYPDGTVVRVFCMQTDRDAYSSGWAYKLHYGVTEPDPTQTLDDGTIRRYLENLRIFDDSSKRLAVSRRQLTRGHQRARTACRTGP